MLIFPSGCSAKLDVDVPQLKEPDVFVFFCRVLQGFEEDFQPTPQSLTWNLNLSPLEEEIPPLFFFNHDFDWFPC